MGTKNNPGRFDCYGNALPEEPMFILLGRDRHAPMVVEFWADLRAGRVAAREVPASDLAMAAEARGCAVDMQRWREENDGKWRDPAVVAAPGAFQLDSAPRDGTTVWLLVDYSNLDEGDHPLADAPMAWTIGHNNFEHDGEDVWRFAGWCWSHDHYTQGRGTPVAWKPVGFDVEFVGTVVTKPVPLAPDSPPS
jgi:hypothetical protein